MLHEEARKKHCPFQQAVCSPHLCMMWEPGAPVLEGTPSSGICLIREHARLTRTLPMMLPKPAPKPIPVHLSEAQKAKLEELLKARTQPGTVEVVGEKGTSEPKGPSMDPNAEYVVDEKRSTGDTIAWKKKPAPRRRSAKKKQK